MSKAVLTLTVGSRESVSQESPANASFLATIPEWRPLLVPIQIMTQPLRKRFRFHFYGNKQTNSLDKVRMYHFKF